MISLTKDACTMENEIFEIESSTLFSKSLIWQLNRDYYQEAGVDAWSKDVVPHHMTSNSMVGKTYAELILGLLKDVAAKGNREETVYLLELGAGHGRLAFHILKHLQRLKSLLQLELPPFCYVLSDIVEENLNFFSNHPQFQTYLDQGILDVSYFDAIKSKELHLRHSKTQIRPGELNQPLLAIANYFFDSLPNDLFLIQDQTISACSVALESKLDTSDMDAESTIKNIDLVYDKNLLKKPFYQQALSNEILEGYKKLVFNTHLFFPQKGLECLANLQQMSKEGLMVISMDKGFYEIHDLEKKKEPEIITHGSFSFWVNYHALGAFCDKQGGNVLFPSFSSFNLQIGCLLFLPEAASYKETNAAYQRFVNDFGPDDFNSIKRLSYRNLARFNLSELIALIRISSYDSVFFKKFLPQIKQLSRRITINERRRLAQTLLQVWDKYFAINEDFDLAYELGGVFYDLGFYKEALIFFQHSTQLFGQKADIFYNQILCYYQLREDQLFIDTLRIAKEAFPGFKKFEELDRLDMNAI